MGFEEILVRLQDVLKHHQEDPRRRAELIGENVLADARALQQAAEPVDPHHLTAAESERLDQVHHHLGWLHLYRWAVLRSLAASEPGAKASTATVDNYHELARAISFFLPHAMSADFVPIPLQPFLGPLSQPYEQIMLACKFLSQESETTSDPVVLDVGIALMTAALTVLPNADQMFLISLSTLSEAYETRFTRNGEMADLQRAIDLRETITARVRPGEPSYAMNLSKHRHLYVRKFEVTLSVDDLLRAIRVGELSVRATPADDPMFGERSNALGDLRREAFIRTGALDHVNRAIELGEQSVANGRPAHPDLAIRLSNLSLAYLERHQATGVAEDLEMAVRLGEEAASIMPEDRYDLAGTLANNAMCYITRYENDGDVASLDRAIQLGERAVAMAPQDDPGLKKYLSNLAISRRKRFERGLDRTDLDRSIEVGEQAVAAATGHPPTFGTTAPALASAYGARYAISSDPNDLDRAVHLGETAVAALPKDHPRHVLNRANLGRYHFLRFVASWDVDDLIRTVEFGKAALEDTPDGDTSLPRTLAGVAIGHHALITLDPSAARPGFARKLADKLATATTAPALDRLNAGQHIGILATAAGDTRTAVEVFDSTASLLPIVASPRVERSDREHVLAQRISLIGQTIAAHLSADDPVGAVEVAELGRGVMFAAELDSRSELTELAEVDEDLAARFEGVRRRLGSFVADDHHADGARRRSWQEYDRLLTRIRELPGLSRFLLPPAYADLQRAVRGGVAVLVNATDERGDAIIIQPEGLPITVPLPGLRAETAHEHLIEFRKAVHERFSLKAILNRKQVFTDVLVWLWDTVVEPVVQAMPGPDREEPTRVWWLPTSAVATLPLHAAGHPGQDGALDHLVSSYVPTLRALAYARNRPGARERRQLTVALERTPGFGDLPGTVVESAALHPAQSDLPLLDNAQATADKVLAQLQTSTWCHFACHAVDDAESPSRSALMLHDRPLQVSEISRLRLESAELAYLSACSTAHTGLRLAEESVHLASAFHLAGFKHVVASLWPLNDAVAADAARYFYRGLLPTADTSTAAHVLRAVVQRLRVEHSDRPDLWASLIHSGP
ncbi:CHAT domain-containing protein [Actinosynnema sp. NPDC059797]